MCKATIAVYMEEVLHCPETEKKWKEVAAGLTSRWNYHNCLGAVDGKHVAMKKPPNEESNYCNYKDFYCRLLWLSLLQVSAFICC